MMNLLDCVKFKSLVSSVLNKDIKQHRVLCSTTKRTRLGVQGKPQWIAIQFDEPQTVKAFSIQFQGGFVAKDAKVFTITDAGEETEELFYPDDINSVQNFTLKTAVDSVKKIKFVFHSSTDFFGRIIVYKLKIL